MKYKLRERRSKIEFVITF